MAGNAMGIGVDELFKETYRVLGGNRVTPVVTDRLSSPLALAARDARLAVVGGVAVLRS